MQDRGTVQVNGSGSASSSGMQPNLAGALSYLLGVITGIIFVLIEKDNQFVRFHAWQSIILSVAWIVFWVGLSIVGTILAFIPVINIIFAVVSIVLSLVLSLGGLVLWILLMVKAYQGARFSLPYIGPMAERYAAGR